jgi:predicted nucleic-acid-binding protein
MARPFVDTNILLRHLLQDHAEQSPRATTFLERIERGELEAQISEMVIFETVFTLQRTYRRSKEDIRTVLLQLLSLPGLVLQHKRRFQDALDVYVLFNISFADAYHAVLMKALRLTEVVSFDADFDRVQGITRLEP